MYLITTADQRFWKTDEPVLFLGEWCKLYSQKHIWETIPHEVLPYHWDDRNKFRRDYVYLQEFYERVLTALSQWLNKIHGEAHDVRYWRVIVGPWLFYFIHVFFDRYECVDQAVKSGKVSAARIGHYDPADWIPQDSGSLEAWSLTDEYNQFLYSWLMGRLFGKCCEPIVLQGRTGPMTSGRGVGGFRVEKKILSQCIRFYEKVIPYRFNDVVLVSSYLDRFDLLRLQLSLGQWPAFQPPAVQLSVAKVDFDMRSRNSLSFGKGCFEEFAAEIIPRQIPSLYVEGYRQMRTRAVAAYPVRPKVILTANAFYGDEAFKMWAAQCLERGARVIGVQHGGHYGTGQHNSSEEHEIKSCDQYWTWGWRGDSFGNIKPMSAGKLNSCRAVKHDPGGDLLLIQNVLPRYAYRLYSVALASTGTLAYLQGQFAFVQLLSSEARQLLSVRLYQIDYGWSQQARWRDRFPNIKYDMGEQPFIKRLESCRLAIATQNTTTYLETFTANVPTIIFWNPDHCELRDSVKPYFDELKRVGIFHDSPESAAQKVNEIAMAPDSWWQQKHVQQAKDIFCQNFGRTSDTWLSEWRGAIHELMNNNRRQG